jgi:LSD1 subclass zinc finger protein
MEDVSKKLNCKGCGGSLAYCAGAQALKCEYCNTLAPIECEGDQGDDGACGARMIVPLTVEQRALEHAVHTLLASGDYTPDDLLDQAVFSGIARFYAPAYLFQGEFEAQWTASFGYDRTEVYTEVETHYENGQPRQVPVTQTRTVTDWRPASGIASNRFSVFGYAGARLSGAPVSLVEQCAGSAQLRDRNAAFAIGIEAEPFTLADPVVYEKRAWPQITAMIEQEVRAHAQGNHQQGWHWSATVDKKAIAVALPVCHVVYVYKGRSYNVWTDGCDASRQVFDALPRDRSRYKDILLGFIPMLAAVATLVLAGSIGQAPGVPAAFLGDGIAGVAAALGYAAWRRHLILGHSRKLRQASLALRSAAGMRDASGRPAKPWLIDGGVDKGALVAGTIACCALALLLTMAQQGRLPV